MLQQNAELDCESWLSILTSANLDLRKKGRFGALSAFRAASLHLLLSVTIAGMAAGLVFDLWFPFPYSEISGGRELFWLVISVDVICGPLLTLVVFRPSKSSRELITDLTAIAILQLAALGYGLYTVVQARPIHLVFEVDRFRVVSAADVEVSQLDAAPQGFKKFSWTGPTLIGTKRAQSGEEVRRSVESALQGIDISMQPAKWISYDQVRADVLHRARPLSELIQRRPESKVLLEHARLKSGLAVDQLWTLPVTSRFSTSWVALLNDSAEPVAFAPVDGF